MGLDDQCGRLMPNFNDPDLFLPPANRYAGPALAQRCYLRCRRHTARRLLLLHKGGKHEMPGGAMGCSPHRTFRDGLHAVGGISRPGGTTEISRWQSRSAGAATGCPPPTSSAPAGRRNERWQSACHWNRRMRMGRRMIPPLLGETKTTWGSGFRNLPEAKAREGRVRGSE